MACLTRHDVPCYIDAAGCVVCPEIIATPAVPANYSNTLVLGWNAGADSIATLDGDLRTTFGLANACVGIVIGFKASRAFGTEPTLIEHGIYLSNAGGHQYANVSELGSQLTVPVLCAPGDLFTIKRTGGVVTYRHNDVLLYTSAVPSVGPVLVNACLYSSGDAIA